MFNLQGDPGPMVPKGNVCKHNTRMAENMRNVNVFRVMLELIDSKTPKVKKRAKKKDHAYTVKKKVSFFFFFNRYHELQIEPFKSISLSFLGGQKSLR